MYIIYDKRYNMLGYVETLDEAKEIKQINDNLNYTEIEKYKNKGL
jgi:hypothetical protein